MQKNHRLRIYPVGNGDTSQIILANGRRILLDFCHRKKGESDKEAHIDLMKELKREIDFPRRNHFDVVALTHADDDHIALSTEFFHLEHAKKYQGEDRVKIKELWVPAALILDTAPKDKQTAEYVIWREEARHRLKEGKGIQVFSKPDKLKEWLSENDLTVDARKNLITDAGQFAKGFSLASDGVEFFCHSPFVEHVDDKEFLRNDASLIFQIRFQINQEFFDYFAFGDTEYENIELIVAKSKKHGNADRLKWNILNVPHHCSYKALAKDKGEERTEPTEKVRELLSMGQAGAYIVSSSNPIDDSIAARSQSLPPHIQAKKAYEAALNLIDGRSFVVTMEHPNRKQPRVIEFEITESGCKLLSAYPDPTTIIGDTRPRRAG